MGLYSSSVNRVLFATTYSIVHEVQAINMVRDRERARKREQSCEARSFSLGRLWLSYAFA